METISRKELSMMFNVDRQTAYIILRDLRPVKMDLPYLWERQPALDLFNQWVQKQKSPRKVARLCSKHKCTVTDIIISGRQFGVGARTRLYTELDIEIYKKIDDVLTAQRCQRENDRESVKADATHIDWWTSEMAADRLGITSSFARRICRTLYRVAINKINYYKAVDVRDALKQFQGQKHVSVSRLIATFRVDTKQVEEDLIAIEANLPISLKDYPYISRQDFEVLWAMYENDDLRRVSRKRYDASRDCAKADKPQSFPQATQDSSPGQTPQPEAPKRRSSPAQSWAREALAGDPAPKKKSWKPEVSHPWREPRKPITQRGVLYIPASKKYRAFYMSTRTLSRVVIGEYDTKNEAVAALERDQPFTFEAQPEPHQFGRYS